VTIEATGLPAQHQRRAVGAAQQRCVLVVAGIHPGPVTLALTDFVRSCHQLRATHGCARATWDRVLTLLGRDPECFRPMITHRLPLQRGLEGFELARQRAASKVMLRP
jgi:threonine dehydrogenase-like Zn-dependent dehydrogenase